MTISFRQLHFLLVVKVSGLFDVFLQVLQLTGTNIDTCFLMLSAHGQLSALRRHKGSPLTLRNHFLQPYNGVRHSLLILLTLATMYCPINV